MILAGYEIGTGRPVTIPATHMAVTGQTQRSGKTTAMEAIVERSGMRAIAFITKRGESAFQFGHIIDPYFKDRSDWRFVKDLFEQLTGYAQNEKEAELISICDGAKSLEHVWERVKRKLETKQSKRHQDMYIRMNAYFEEIMPPLAQIPKSKRLDLKKGVNVIDMTSFEGQHSVQEMLIQNALQWVYEKEEKTIFIVPEAWDFLSEEHGSITRTAGREFIRRSAAMHNFLWADCQDIRGLDKVILGQMGVWMVGNQREMNEVGRTIKSFASLPAPPTPTEIMTLGIGEFFILHGTESKKTFVQAVWADAHACALYAKNRDANGAARMALPKMPPPPPGTKRRELVAAPSVGRIEDGTPLEDHEFDVRLSMEDPAPADNRTHRRNGGTVGALEDIAHETARKTFLPTDEPTESAADELRHAALRIGHQQDVEIAALRGEVRALAAAFAEFVKGGTMNRAESQAIKNNALAKMSAVPAGDDREELYQWFRDRIRRDPELLAIVVSKPSIEVRVDRPTLQVDGNTLKGQLGRLITEKFFANPRALGEARVEMIRRGFISSKLPQNKVEQAVDTLLGMGFFTKESDGYQAVDGMKVRSVEA